MINESEPRRLHLFACLTIIIVGSMVYSNTIHSSFHFDDHKNIVDNVLIRDIRNIPLFFQENKYTSPSRGVVTTTFAINYYFSGLAVEGYHWTNIAIHLLNGILVYFLATIILGQYILEVDSRNASRIRVLSLFVALLFVTSPVQTHTVNYIVQRNGELATTFYLLSFLFFAKAVSQNMIDLSLYLYSNVFFLGGIWCKEIAYTAFIMMFLYYVCFVTGDWRRWPRGLKLTAPYIVLAFVSIQIAVPIHQAPPLGLQLPVGQEVIANIKNPWQYPLTEAGVVIEYIKLLTWPLPGKLNVDYNVTGVSTLWEPSTLISIAIIMGLLFAALILLNRAKPVAFSILWFLVILSPTSSIFALDEFMACYRLYLPGLAFYLAVVVGVHKLFCYLGEKKGVKPRRLYLAEMTVLTCIVLFYSVCAYEHNKVWKTGVSLWGDAVQKSPRKLRPHYNLGKAYELDGMLEKAEAEYAKCIEMFEGSPNSERRLGLGSYYHASLALASIYSNRGKHAKAVAVYKRCLRIVYWEADGHNNLGLAYYRAGHLEEAEREFRLAIEFNPGLSVAYENLGALYEVKGELNAALAAFTEAVTTDPQNGKAHVRLGQLWWNFKNRPDMALMHLDDALKSDLDEEVSKRVLAAIDTIKTQASHLLRPAIGKAL